MNPNDPEAQENKAIAYGLTPESKADIAVSQDIFDAVERLKSGKPGKDDAPYSALIGPVIILQAGLPLGHLVALSPIGERCIQAIQADTMKASIEAAQAKTEDEYDEAVMDEARQRRDRKNHL